MQTVHGSHHRGRVTEQDHKQLLRKRQSQIYLVDLPEEDFVETKDGQFRCVVCPHLPPFTSGKLLADHIKGKKHLARKQCRLERKEIPIKSSSTNTKSNPETVKPSISMPSLLQRTNAITKRVLESNHSTTTHTPPSSTSPTSLSNPVIFSPPACVPSEEPLWRKQMLQKKEEEQLYAKGFRKNENGEWYRDETVEFDSDDEPDLASLLSSFVK